MARRIADAYHVLQHEQDGLRRHVAETGKLADREKRRSASVRRRASCTSSVTRRPPRCATQSRLAAGGKPLRASSRDRFHRAIGVVTGRADLHRHRQRHTPEVRLHEIRRTPQARNGSGATQADDRHPLHIGPKPHVSNQMAPNVWADVSGRAATTRRSTSLHDKPAFVEARLCRAAAGVTSATSISSSRCRVTSQLARPRSRSS
jgi:hypothetical protein